MIMEPSILTLWGRSRDEYLSLTKLIPQGIDLYQLIAPKRTLIDQTILESRYDLTSSELRTELTCPICMGILQGTMVIKNCLHRFCGDCIEKCFRIGIKECPQCRNHVPSRRALRKDLVFDKIINRLFPNVKDFEDKNEHLVTQSNKRLSIQSEDSQPIFDIEMIGSRSVSPSPTSSPHTFLRKSYLSSDILSRNNLCRNTSASSNDQVHNDFKLSKAERKRKRREISNQMKKIPFDGLLHFEVLPDPAIPSLPELKYNNKLDTPGFFSIQHLSRYITSILNLNKGQILKFYTKNHKIPFLPTSSLAHVHHQSFCFSNEIVVLYYTTRNYVDLPACNSKVH